MITEILTHGVAALAGAIIGIFIYRNNLKLISKRADKVDNVWDKLELTDKFEDLGDKIEELKKDL